MPCDALFFSPSFIFSFSPSPSLSLLTLCFFSLSPLLSPLLSYPIPFYSIFDFLSTYNSVRARPTPLPPYPFLPLDIHPEMGCLHVVPGSHLDFKEGLGHGDVSALSATIIFIFTHFFVILYWVHCLCRVELLCHDLNSRSEAS